MVTAIIGIGGLGSVIARRLAPYVEWIHLLYGGLDALAHATPPDLIDDCAW
jgi:hypothetical protein